MLAAYVIRRAPIQCAEERRRLKPTVLLGLLVALQLSPLPSLVCESTCGHATTATSSASARCHGQQGGSVTRLASAQTCAHDHLSMTLGQARVQRAADASKMVLVVGGSTTQPYSDALSSLQPALGSIDTPPAPDRRGLFVLRT